MNNPRPSQTAFPLLLVLCMFAQTGGRSVPAAADPVLIAPQRVTATSTDTDWTRAENTVDGSGMSKQTLSSARSSQSTTMPYFWRTQPDMLTAQVTYDLGALFPLGGVHVWNYNETGQTNRGVKNMTVAVSEDGREWLEGEDVVLPRAPGNDDPGSRHSFRKVVSARYIRFDIQSNHGDEHFTGLSEVRGAVSLDSPSRVQLAELDLAKGAQRHGVPIANRSVTGTPLAIAGKPYPRGIGSHAQFKLRINLRSTGIRFVADVGVDDYHPAPNDQLVKIPQADGSMRVTREDKSGEQFIAITTQHGRIADGRVVFRLLGDDRELWTSGLVKRGEAARRVDVDVRGVSVLTLVVEDGGDGVSGDYADWANAGLIYAGPRPVTIDEHDDGDSLRSALAPPVEAFVKDLPAYPGRKRPATDWLIDNRSYAAGVYRGQRRGELVLDNGLVSRVFKLSPNAAALDIYDHVTGRTLLRGIKPEANLQIGNMTYPVGGLAGQLDYGYLDYAWLKHLRLMPNAFVLSDISTSEIVPRVEWPRKRRHDKHTAWPPRGVSIHMKYTCPALPGVEVTVHYNLYDGMPLFCKWLTIEQGGIADLHLNTYESDILALTEYNATVNEGYGDIEATPQTIILETDYAFGGSYQFSTKSHSIEYVKDPQYHSQVNYARTSRVLAVSRPEVGPDVMLEKGSSFSSHRTWELITDGDHRERRSLAQRRMYRTVAPWVTENPSVMHVRSAAEPAVKAAIDQCEEVGFETVILTFGSGANIEDMSQKNLDYLKRLADYAGSKGIEIGGYSLLASSRRGAEASIISLTTGKPGGGRYGNAPCLASDWGDGYFANLRRFYEYTGFTLFEHDGSYPGDRCASTKHHHRGAGDSQWTQFQIITDHYNWCLANNVYMNVPDWYFMNGSHKCAMHYREANFALPRARHTLLARRDIFDGTWEKTPSMGWMHVPLVAYHGGQANSVFEPLSENLDDYRFVLMQNFLLGVQGHYRGHRLYDTEETKQMVKHIVEFYGKHWDILNSDVVHFRRPNGRTIDGMLHVNPQLEEKACLVLFNSTDQTLRETLHVPLYYAGLTTGTRVTDMGGQTQVKDLARDYSIDLDVELPPRSVRCYFFADKTGHN